MRKRVFLLVFIVLCWWPVGESAAAGFVAFLGCTSMNWRFSDQAWYGVPWYFVLGTSRGSSPMTRFTYVADTGRLETQYAYLVNSFAWGGGGHGNASPPQYGGQTICANMETFRFNGAPFVPNPMPADWHDKYRNPAFLSGSELAKGLSLAGLIGLGILFLFGGVLVYYGFDLDTWGESDRRAAWTKSYAALAVVSLFTILIYWGAWVYDPVEELGKLQTYYDFYDSLAKSGYNGFPVPISGNQERYLTFAGDQWNWFRPEDFIADIGGFMTFSLVITAALIIIFGRRMYRGYDYLFVPHPAERLVNDAIVMGSSINTAGLADSLHVNPSEFDDPKPAWHYRHQAEKARGLADKLDADAELAKSAVRRERARRQERDGS